MYISLTSQVGLRDIFQEPVIIFPPGSIRGISQIWICPMEDLPRQSCPKETFSARHIEMRMGQTIQ